MKFYKMALLVAAQSFMFLGCSKSTPDTNTTTCSSSTVCSSTFAQVNVTLMDPNGVPVILDSSYTVRKSTGERIRPTQQTYAPNVYIVLDDNYQKNLQNATDTFIFTGYISTRMRVQEPFVISADCCHIKYISGKQVVVVLP